MDPWLNSGGGRGGAEERRAGRTAPFAGAENKKRFSYWFKITFTGKIVPGNSSAILLGTCLPRPAGAVGADAAATWTEDFCINTKHARNPLFCWEKIVFLPGRVFLQHSWGGRGRRGRVTSDVPAPVVARFEPGAVARKLCSKKTNYFFSMGNTTTQAFSISSSKSKKLLEWP